MRTKSYGRLFFSGICKKNYCADAQLAGEMPSWRPLSWRNCVQNGEMQRSLRCANRPLLIDQGRSPSLMRSFLSKKKVSGWIHQVHRSDIVDPIKFGDYDLGASSYEFIFIRMVVLARQCKNTNWFADHWRSLLLSKAVPYPSKQRNTTSRDHLTKCWLEPFGNTTLKRSSNLYLLPEEKSADQGNTREIWHWCLTSSCGDQSRSGIRYSKMLVCPETVQAGHTRIIEQRSEPARDLLWRSYRSTLVHWNLLWIFRTGH